MPRWCGVVWLGRPSGFHCSQRENGSVEYERGSSMRWFIGSVGCSSKVQVLYRSTARRLATALVAVARTVTTGSITPLCDAEHGSTARVQYVSCAEQACNSQAQQARLPRQTHEHCWQGYPSTGDAAALGHQTAACKSRYWRPERCHNLLQKPNRIGLMGSVDTCTHKMDQQTVMF